MRFKMLISGLLMLCLVVGGAVGLSTVGGLTENSAITASASEYFTSGDYTYEILEDDTVRVCLYNGRDTVVDIPSEIDGKKVTSIGRFCFYKNYGITQVTIPDSVEVIRDNAFEYCISLESITIPESVTSIGEYAFCGSGLTSITIPKSVIEIGSYAFRDCYCLTKLTISEGVQTIKAYSFSRCIQLTSITIPKSVTTIEAAAFLGDVGLTSVKLPKGLTSINDELFYGCKNLKNVTIPDTVTSIGVSAFEGCGSLNDVTIPEAVTFIGGSAFKSCYGITSIKLPDNLKGIGESAFSCSSLKSIKIPSNVKTVGSYAFQYCSNLTSVTIPDGVTEIKFDTFYGCKRLTKVTIPDSVTRIEQSAFEGCSALKNINLPKKLRIIDNYAFYCCENMTSITIPASVDYIGRYSFGFIKEETDGHLKDFIKIKSFKIYYETDRSYGVKYAKDYGFQCEDIHIHTYTANVIKPTTSTEGYTEYACSGCNSRYKADYVDKLIDLSKCKATIAKSSYTYTGKAIKPTVTVKYGTKKLTKGRDYTVSYKNNTKTGKATITIKGKGKYTGTITKNFNIVPKKATLSSVKAPKVRVMQVTWKKDSQASGYDIVYALNSTFTYGRMTVNVPKNSTTSKTISKLYKERTYYVKIRSYKLIDGKKVYGDFSAVKKIKSK